MDPPKQPFRRLGVFERICPNPPEIRQEISETPTDNGNLSTLSPESLLSMDLLDDLNFVGEQASASNPQQSAAENMNGSTSVPNNPLILPRLIPLNPAFNLSVSNGVPRAIVKTTLSQEHIRSSNSMEMYSAQVNYTVPPPPLPHMPDVFESAMMCSSGNNSPYSILPLALHTSSPKPIQNRSCFPNLPKCPNPCIEPEPRPNASLHSVLDTIAYASTSVLNNISYSEEFSAHMAPATILGDPFMGFNGNLSLSSTPVVNDQQNHMSGSLQVSIPPGFEHSVNMHGQLDPTPQENFQYLDPLDNFMMNWNITNAEEHAPYLQNMSAPSLETQGPPELMVNGYQNNQMIPPGYPVLPPQGPIGTGIPNINCSFQPALNSSLAIANVPQNPMHDQEVQGYQTINMENVIEISSNDSQEIISLSDSSPDGDEGAAANVPPVEAVQAPVIVCALPVEFDDYVLGERISTGAFSDVYKAYSKKNQRTVAIKAYHITSENRDHYLRAANDIAFLRMVDHPNILKYISADMKKEYIYFSFDYTPYGSLRNFLNSRVKLTEQTVQCVMRELMSALCYLHTLLIFHGNICPESIMVVDVGNLLSIKLTNFECSEISMQCQNITKKTGSFYYQAPEVHFGNHVDCKSDLFSAGIVMYEMLYGFVPFPLVASREVFLDFLRVRSAIDFPAFKTSLLSRYCVNLLTNLLNYDKDIRFSIKDVLSHPFINAYAWGDAQHHYQNGYNCYLTGTDLAQEKRFGPACIETTKAVLHLQISLDRTTDKALREHISLKLQKYKRYVKIFLEHLLNDSIKTPLLMPKNVEKLRYLLVESRDVRLLEAYDLCMKGEIHYRLKDKCAEGMVKKGVGIIVRKMLNEPSGPLKELLAEKVKQWMRFLGLFVIP